MLGLCASDRYSRFCRPACDRTVADYVDRIDWVEWIAFGAFQHGARLTGVVELCNAGVNAEIALAVVREERHKGIGRILLDRALAQARAMGKEAVVLTCLAGNEPMRRLARSAGLIAGRSLDGANDTSAHEEQDTGNANILYASALR
jgi:GNAT superfamily N-acetyltransferase